MRVAARREVEQGECGKSGDRCDEQDRDAPAPADVPRRHQRRHGRAGDHRGHRADVGAQAAPGHGEREHPAPHGEAPHANARGSGRERAAEPEQAHRGERDLELVSRAEEARAEDGVRAEERAAHQLRAERQVGHVQRHRDRRRQDQRPRPWAACGPSRGRAPRTRRRRSAPPPEPREPAHRSAAARSGATSRPAGRRAPATVRRVAQARQAPAIATAPIRPSQITAHRRGPRSVSRFRSSERSAGLASPRASIGSPVMSSGTGTSRRSSTVGATSVELTSPSRAGRVRIQRGAPAEPGRAHRHEPPGDVARVLDHQHEVGRTTRREELSELSVTRRSGRQLHHEHIGIAPQRPRGARDRPGAHERDALDATRPVGRDGRLPVARCPRARVADMPAGPANGRRKQARHHVGRSGARPVRRSPAMRTCGRPGASRRSVGTSSS